MNSKAKLAFKTSLKSAAANFLLCLVKAFAGIIGNSHALVADAIESASDLCASLLVSVGIKISAKPADSNHPYGHGKAEILVSLLVVSFFWLSAAYIAYSSIVNILTPHPLPKWWTLLVLFAIIIWKEVCFRLVINKSIETNSSALRAEAWHHRSDAISSIAAFVGISIALWGGMGYETADDWAALFAAFLIIYNSISLLKPALAELMDEHVYDDLVLEIRSHAVDVPGILATEKCFIRKSGMQYHIDLHAVVDGNISVKEGHHLAHQLQDYLKLKIGGLGQILIHIEPNN